MAWPLCELGAWGGAVSTEEAGAEGGPFLPGVLQAGTGDRGCPCGLPSQSPKE